MAVFVFKFSNILQERDHVSYTKKNCIYGEQQCQSGHYVDALSFESVKNIHQSLLMVHKFHIIEIGKCLQSVKWQLCCVNRASAVCVVDQLTSSMYISHTVMRFGCRRAVQFDQAFSWGTQQLFDSILIEFKNCLIFTELFILIITISTHF